MVISTLTGSTTPITATIVSQIDSTVAKQVENKKSVREIARGIDSIFSTEQYVREYFKDIPIMIAIAKCESRFRQLDPDGEIHRGELNNADVGVMQINEFYHGKTAERKDYDIYTIEGNTAYARNLYERKGTAPWASSRACWSRFESKDLAINK